MAKKNVRVEISSKALKVLHIETAISGLNQIDVLEALILKGASPQTLALLENKPLSAKPPLTPKMDIATKKSEMEVMENRAAITTTGPNEARPALLAILAELKKGNEPTVNTISDKLGLTTTGLGRILSAVGIKSQNTHRENKTVRIYTRSMIPSIEAILSTVQN